MASLGPDGGQRDIVYLALEFKTLCSVGGLDGIYNIVELLMGLLYRVAEGSILVGRNAAANAEVQTPSLQQDVEHGYLMG